MKYAKTALSAIILLGLSVLALPGMQAPHPTLHQFFTTAHGASVVPVTHRQGHMYVLLAREAAGNDKGTYDAFGGSKDPGETHPNDTASRELAEETVYLLGNEQHLRNYIDIDNGHTKNIIANYNKRFVVYITEFHHDKLDKLIQEFHARRNSATSFKFKEKDKLAWIKYDDLKDTIANAPRDNTGRLITPIMVKAYVHEKSGQVCKTIPLRPVFASSLQRFFQGKPATDTGHNPKILFY